MALRCAMPWAPYPLEDDARDSRVAFGRGLRALRLYQGWSQVVLAREALVHQSVISRLETGRHIPLRFKTVLRILETMGVDRMVFKSRWEGSTLLAHAMRFEPDTLGPAPPPFPWLVHEPQRDPWDQPWIDDTRELVAYDLVVAGVPERLAEAMVNEALSAEARFVDVRLLDERPADPP